MYTDIKTVADAFKARDLDISEVPDFSNVPEKYRKPMLDHFKLVIVAEALNEGWAPNWDDEDEFKYYPWFDMEKGFVFVGCDYYVTSSSVGSRLCFRSREVVNHLVAQPEFFELYKSYFTIAP